MLDESLLQNLFGNSEETKLVICTVIFCLVFTVRTKWRVEIRAKIGPYRNRFFIFYCLFFLLTTEASCMGGVCLRKPVYQRLFVVGLVFKDMLTNSLSRSATTVLYITFLCIHVFPLC